ncbi:MAG: hypothetical protein K8T91_24980 [Planctomycetes bacterium]|nr:hypothetical protein [Planctomycetota bacterium]
MSDRIATTPADIINAIKQRLIDDEVFTESTIRMRKNKQLVLADPPRSECFGVLVPGGFQFDLPKVAGGGRAVTCSDWSISLHVVVQLLLDQGDADDQFLTHQTLGILAKVHDAVDSLQLFDPEDEENPTEGNLLLSKPMRIESINDGSKEPAKWGVYELTWHVPFKWDLN